MSASATPRTARRSASGRPDMASLFSFGRALGLSGTTLRRAALGIAIGIAAGRLGRSVRNRSHLTPLVIPESWPLDARCVASLRCATRQGRADLLARVAAHIPEGRDDPCAALGALHESLLQASPARGTSTGTHARKTAGAYFT